MKRFLSVLFCLVLLCNCTIAFAVDLDVPASDTTTVPIDTPEDLLALADFCGHNHTYESNTFSYRECLYDYYHWELICSDCDAVLDADVIGHPTGKHYGSSHFEEAVIDGVSGIAEFCNTCDALIDFTPD